ncbi:type IV pilus assembly protein PilM [Candidatus Woesebacteria bacterium]|nr:type IV pilus assembly protein PilM [Candidatus Woesebacteria bacterium]MCD8546007.1 type IV pilus assembly protein PilM [Candidatus Woesebacteria bacterium]
MKVVGLDIGSYAIKAVVGKPQKNGAEILQAVEVPNPIGAIYPDNPQKRQQLIDTLVKMFTDYKLPQTNVRVALAEQMVSTKLVTMPLLSEAELASAIQWQVEQHIPIPLEEMEYEYAVLRRSGKDDPTQNMDVLMIGVKKQFVNDFADLLLEANLDVIDMETDTLAQLRVLQFLSPSEENVALFHIGASSSVIALIGKGRVQFVHAVPMAGILFSRAIERGVGLDAMRAEEYKRTYGLLASQLEGRVRNALVPVIDSLVTEIQKALRFFSGQNAGETIQRIFVTGGSLYLPDLLPYLSQAVSVEMVPVELNRIEQLKWSEPVQQDSRFIIATGLAMKSEK